MTEKPDNQRKKLLDVTGLKTYYDVEDQPGSQLTAKAVDGVDFHIFENEVFALVGESGCGKTQTALSILRLIPNPPGRIESGAILFEGIDLVKKSYRQMQQIRGNAISMIFQEPMTALNPVFSIGWQLREAIRSHGGNLSKEKIRNRAVEMLQLVGIPDAVKRMHNYPHQFSGGMRQRVMIAMALAMEPKLLIADEPTTALDVTIQAQILDLILEVRKKTGNTAVLLITHDLAVVAETAERVAVMYGGRIQEIASVSELFKHPLHPYTRGLLKSLPRPDQTKKERLATIPGIVPSSTSFPPGCKFSTRCAEKIPLCQRVEPPLIECRPNHLCRCHVVQKKLNKGALTSSTETQTKEKRS